MFAIDHSQLDERELVFFWQCSMNNGGDDLDGLICETWSCTRAVDKKMWHYGACLVLTDKSALFVLFPKSFPEQFCLKSGQVSIKIGEFFDIETRVDLPYKNIPLVNRTLFQADHSLVVHVYAYKQTIVWTFVAQIMAILNP